MGEVLKLGGFMGVRTMLVCSFVFIICHLCPLLHRRMGEVLKLGGFMGLRTMLVWGVLGMAWWKVLG